jgi:hypothetical protein
MVAHYMVDVLAWVLPMLFATGWVLGWAHFRKSLHDRHPDLYEQWYKRTHPDEEDKS